MKSVKMIAILERRLKIQTRSLRTCVTHLYAYK
jgi:hypothetical protein